MDNHYLLDFPTRLSAADLEALELPITPAEIAAARAALPTGKAIGPDGIPLEFYNTFLPELADGLLTLFHSTQLDSSPPES